ncbi:hypothetical protein ABZ646_36685 [Streptomyces sp. NPDC007162]|uniref:hypothetical protein n=1 Tax=Streptomyces sp. NPDC007162 TaxID=3156917 RepID=UPI0033E53588
MNALTVCRSYGGASTSSTSHWSSVFVNGFSRGEFRRGVRRGAGTAVHKNSRAKRR